MSSKNPMRNKETAKKVGIKHGRAVIINDVRYYGLIEASRILKKCEPTIRDWCKRGYDSWGNPCRYEDEPQKKVSNLRKLHPLSTRHKAVIVDGKFFTTVMDGASYLKITPQQFVYFLKQNRSPKGHKCEYANQQPS